MPSTSNALFRRLPSVDEILRDPALSELCSQEGMAAVTDAAREVLAKVRAEITSGALDEQSVHLALSGLADAIHRQLAETLSFSLRSVINATGVVLHTNLGRAPLSQSALRHIAEVAGAYSNLEFDLSSGERGKRDVHVQRLFARLFADASRHPLQTVVVNNCAAAVMLALNSLAEGGEVIVSRGELVEIGGSFRVPDVMAKSQAVLREVGTTNRTRIQDYERVITERTRLLLRVHRSNFSIVGFTEQPTLAELVTLGQKHKIPVMEDLGNGALLDLRSVGVKDEPGILESLRAEVDVITCSGDKLLGGPQAGIITGREELVARIRSNPMFRALRVDKLTYAALEATLQEYIRQNHNAIPVLRMLRADAEAVRARAQAIAGNVSDRFQAQVIPGESVIGGGTTPSAVLPTYLIALGGEHLSADALQNKLRNSEPPIIARVEEGKVLLDLRTVFPEQDAILQQVLQSLA